MKRFVLLAAPMMLLLAGLVAGSAQALPDERSLPVMTTTPAPAAGLRGESFRPEVQQQVRIEQRITIRVAPRTVLASPLVAEIDAESSPRFDERKMGKCVAVGGIGGVQIGGDDKLMLFMRDQRIVSVTLEKACSARDFYSGFYIERSADGMLCVDRDKLQSRTGANCSLRRMRQLIERN